MGTGPIELRQGEAALLGAALQSFPLCSTSFSRIKGSIGDTVTELQEVSGLPRSNTNLNPASKLTVGLGVNMASEFTKGLTAVKAVRRHSELFTQHRNNQEQQVKTFPWSQSPNSKLAKVGVTDGGEAGEAAAVWRAGKPLG